MSAPERTSLDNAPFQCLGYDHGTYYYRPKATGEITPLTCGQHRQGSLLTLAPLAWWENTFPRGRGVDWRMAIDAMYRASQKVGPYRAEER